MTDLYITQHAIERYRERVRDGTDDEIRAALDTLATRAAAQIGARFVRLHGGQRVVLHDCTVVTVMPSDNYRRQVRRRGMGRYGRMTRTIGTRTDGVD